MTGPEGRLRRTLTRARERPPVLAATLGIATVGLVEHLHLARNVGRLTTNEDAALMWYAAREWGELRLLRQPNVYGQMYGATPEALPVEVLRWLGLQLGTALPVVLAASSIAGWFLLAAVTVRRGRPGVALGAVAAPVILSSYHTYIITTVPTYQGPHFLAVCGAALILARPRHIAIESLAWSLLGLGLAADPSTSLLSVPVAAWWLLDRRSWARHARVILVGAVAPAAYLAWWLTFYRSHPDHNIFGGLTAQPSWDTFGQSFGKLARFFTLSVLEVAPYWPLAAIVICLLTAVLVRTRTVRYVVPAVLVPALVLWGLATSRAEQDLGAFLSPGRIFALLPHAIWFLCFLVADSAALERFHRPMRVAVAAVAVLAVVSVGLRLADHDGRVLALRDESLVSVGYRFVSTRSVLDACDEMSRLARREGAPLSIVDDDSSFLRAVAYGCGARHHDQLETLLTRFERRTWRLHEERERERTTALLWNVDPRFCDFAAPRVEGCTAVGPGIASLRFTPQSVLELLLKLDVNVRQFGPDCAPRPLFGTFVCDRPLEIEVSDLVTAPPPADEVGAGRDIQRAIEQWRQGRVGQVVEQGGTLAARARQRGRDLARDYADVVVRITRIRYLSDRQAVVDLSVRAADADTEPVRAWAVRTGRSWLVERRTACALDAIAVDRGEVCDV